MIAVRERLTPGDDPITVRASRGLLDNHVFTRPGTKVPRRGVCTEFGDGGMTEPFTGVTGRLSPTARRIPETTCSVPVSLLPTICSPAFVRVTRIYTP